MISSLPACIADVLSVAANTTFLVFFNDTATTDIYTLSLHDALPISILRGSSRIRAPEAAGGDCGTAVSEAKTTAERKAKGIAAARRPINMRAILAENATPRKQPKEAANIFAGYFLASTGSSSGE